MEDKQSNSKNTIFLAGLVVALLIAAGFIYLPRLQERWSEPLGPGLGLPTLTPTLLAVVEQPTEPVATRVAPSSTGTGETQPAVPSETATEHPATATTAPTVTPAPVCGGPPVMTLLAIGADSGVDYRYGLADVIRIVRADFVEQKISVLSMPRDLWVEIPDISDNYDITHGKLNQSYFYGGPGMGYYDGPGGGPGLLARTLDLNFGLRVDHYGAVNMQTFVKIVDAVGGIDLYLPTDVDGTPIDEKTEDMGYFYAGNNHFTGQEALRFARIRKRYNDFTRMDNQNMVLCALREKVLSPAVLPKLPKIVAAFQDSVQTDVSPEQISQLACLLSKTDRESLLFTSLPQDLFEPGRAYSEVYENTTFVLEADYDEIRDYTARFMDGTWPTEPKEPTCP